MPHGMTSFSDLSRVHWRGIDVPVECWTQGGMAIEFLCCPGRMQPVVAQLADQVCEA